MWTEAEGRDWHYSLRGTQFTIPQNMPYDIYVITPNKQNVIYLINLWYV